MHRKSLLVTLADSSHAPAGHLHPLLLVLFVGSGCSALIYEIVWFQLLTLVIGSSAVSLAALLGTFMGGMCLGSLLFARVVSPARHPLRVYALLELGIGISGVVLLHLLPSAGAVYAAHAAGGMEGIVLRGALCAVCLLPPTVLMGATLPAIARWMESTPEGIARLGLFYGANIAGAVFGCLVAAFYLLRMHDVAVATYAAAAVNLAVAVAGLVAARLAEYRPERLRPVGPLPNRTEGAATVYLAICLSGAAALGAEVIWTRILSLLLGATVYAFAIILAVFLAGLGIGSALGAALARDGRRARTALGVCQLLLTAAIAWAAYALTASLPYWPIDASLSTSAWNGFQLDIVRCLWAMLPAACLWGASFPLALAAAAGNGPDQGRLVGSVYAANTLGAIAGALLFSLLLIATLGTRRSEQLLIAVSALAALLVLVPRPRHVRPPSAPEVSVGRNRALGVFGLLAPPILAVLMILSVPPIPPGLIAYGRYLPTYSQMPDFLYSGEGMNASIAVSETPQGVRNFHVSGKIVASSGAQDMRLQRMLCHLPALLHPRPRSVLVVGCGAGVTAGSFVIHPDIERIVICEIEPLIPPAAGRYFAYENFGVLNDRRVTVVCDDARHYIATAAEKFDIITSDPIHPWVKGAAALYSLEYFELCKRRLNPGGIVTQWVPLYESNLEAVKSEIATFFAAHPYGTIWSNDILGEGYDLVLLGQNEPVAIDADRLQRRLDRPDHCLVLDSLDEIQLGSALRMLSTYAGRARDLRGWSSDAAITRDHNLRLQYLAGLGLNKVEATSIYESFLAFRDYPNDMFEETGVQGAALKAVLKRQE